MTSPLDQLRTDWYQTEATVVVTILVKNVQQEHFQVDIAEKSLKVTIALPDVDEKLLHFALSHRIVPECSSYKIMSTKIEIKLKKVDGIRWERLEGEADEEIKPIPVAPSLNEKPPSYPTSKGTDWSAIEKEITAAEAKEKPEGEDGLNQLFQKIYGQGSDEVKKAMNKSFMESGGTVLSTNWNEIGEKKVDVKPPDGMEWKKWD